MTDKKTTSKTKKTKLPAGSVAKKTRMPTPDLEGAFDKTWQIAGFGGILLAREFQFHSVRKWRFDRAHPSTLVAVEIDGATHGTGKPCPTCGQRRRGGHSTGAAQSRDYEKRNTAVGLGWAVFNFTTDMLRADPLGCASIVADEIQSRIDNRR